MALSWNKSLVIVYGYLTRIQQNLLYLDPLQIQEQPEQVRFLPHQWPGDRL